MARKMRWGGLNDRREAKVERRAGRRRRGVGMVGGKVADECCWFPLDWCAFESVFERGGRGLR